MNTRRILDGIAKLAGMLLLLLICLWLMPNGPVKSLVISVLWFSIRFDMIVNVLSLVATGFGFTRTKKYKIIGHLSNIAIYMGMGLIAIDSNVPGNLVGAIGKIFLNLRFLCKEIRRQTWGDVKGTPAIKRHRK